MTTRVATNGQVDAMVNSSDQLNCLYYPFSRLLDDATLKHLLLVFDSLTFVDEAESAKWRRILMQRMEKIDGPTFGSYEKLADDYDMLAETKAVRIVSPVSVNAAQSMAVALATKADLSDPKFVAIASNPGAYDLVARPLGYYGGLPAGRPTWQAFMGKISRPLLADKEFTSDQQWASHVLVPGDANIAWSLSYEAGSAAVINFYLEAAQELRLTPVTTSQLHHELVLRKLKRVFADSKESIDQIDESERKRFRAVFGQGEMIKLLSELYPASGLKRVSFKEIMKFRNETIELRRKFVREVDGILRVIDSDPASASYDREVVEAINGIKTDFVKLEHDLTSVRDKILPAFAESLLSGAAGGGTLGLFASYLGRFSMSGLVVASALSVSGAFLVKALDLWTEKRKSLRNQSSSVSYLTRVSQLVGR